MAIRTPAEVFPPGDFLREELEARDWTQADLAEIISRDVTLVNSIVTGKRSITPETALGLAAAFGTSPEFWLQLEQAYQLWRARDKDIGSIPLRAKLYSAAPVSDMVRRGWIEPSEDAEVLEKRLLAFFDVNEIEEIQEPFAYAARKSTSYSVHTTPSQRAWLARAKQLAHSVQAAHYVPDSVDNVLAQLRLLYHTPEDTRHVPRILSENGIRFVLVQQLAGNKIDGACFWMDDAPVIALSMRYDRIDNFWFTLMHELGHCSQQDFSIDSNLDTSRSNSDKPDNERTADDFALKSLIDPNDLSNFIVRKKPHYSTQAIAVFAQTKGVHPGIVVGQLQYRGELKWEHFRKMLVPVLDNITASALTDGWGNGSVKQT